MEIVDRVRNNLAERIDLYYGKTHVPGKEMELFQYVLVGDEETISFTNPKKVAEYIAERAVSVRDEALSQLELTQSERRLIGDLVHLNYDGQLGVIIQYLDTEKIQNGFAVYLLKQGDHEPFETELLKALEGK